MTLRIRICYIYATIQSYPEARKSRKLLRCDQSCSCSFSFILTLPQSSSSSILHLQALSSPSSSSTLPLRASSPLLSAAHPSPSSPLPSKRNQSSMLKHRSQTSKPKRVSPRLLLAPKPLPIQRINPFFLPLFLLYLFFPRAHNVRDRHRHPADYVAHGRCGFVEDFAYGVAYWGEEACGREKEEGLVFC